jgi:hypothetical protein
MPIWATTKDSDYEVAPEGLWHAVCVDVVDLGIVESKFGQQVKIEIRWQLEERDSKGRPFLIVQRYTPSLHDKSRLKPMLEAWRGRKFTAEEQKKFDIEKLLGANCQLQIIHNIKDEGKTYANVQAVVPPPRNAAMLRPSEDYVRVVNRPQDHNNSPAFNGKANGREANDDSYVPF